MSAFLRDFPGFEILNAEDDALLERLMVVETHKRGHTFVHQGRSAISGTAPMYLILHGAVKVEAFAPKGGFGITREMGRGQLFGVVAFVTDRKRSATVTALGTVTTARLDHRTFNALYGSDAGLHARFQMAIARQLATDIRRSIRTLAAAIESGDCGPLVDQMEG